MPIVESTQEIKPGKKLYFRRWETEQPQKGVVILIHGLGDHVCRYNHVGDFFNWAGYTLVGMDLPGHGQSYGKRGHAGFEDIYPLITTMLKTESEAAPALPIFLYGHSMGGNITLNYILRFFPKIAGAIVTSPGIRPADPLPAPKRALARIMQRVYPSFVMGNGLDIDGLSRDPAIKPAYLNDPLVHAKVSAKLGWDIISKGEWLLEQARDLPIPILLLQGDADRLVDPKATQAFAESIKKNLTYKLYDGFFHELHNEPEKATILALMVEWMDRHRSIKNDESENQ
ncbi:MAG: alpha/beta hydrolase [Anaerolineae bacterium]|nr:alpha/beta hydrolase [Anaerolineae bacterium]